MAYGLLLAVVSLIPNPAIPGIFSWGDVFSPDKVAHFGAYAVFAVLLSVSLPPSSRGRRAITAVLLSAVFGAVMEGLQAAVGTGRDADPADMVANLMGAILGGLAYLAFAPILNKPFAQAKMKR